MTEFCMVRNMERLGEDAYVMVYEKLKPQYEKREN